MANPTKSGWYTNTVLAALLATAQTGTGGLNFSLSTWKISLLTYATSSDGASPIQFQTTTQAWVNTFEATGTGWVTGGITLATAATGSTNVTPTVTLTGASPYSITYNWTNPLSVAGTTLTGVGGFIIYADPLSAPIVKPMVLYINFGAGYSTVAGVFGVTPSGSGLSALTLTQ
jgi:hypothetical protein